MWISWRTEVKNFRVEEKTKQSKEVEKGNWQQKKRKKNQLKKKQRDAEEQKKINSFFVYFFFFFQKTGTYQISVVASSLGKPVYCAAQSFKFTRIYPLSQKDIPHNTTVV